MEPHDVFSIDGYNLKTVSNILLHQALIGTVLSIVMPDGRKLHISVEEVVDPDYVRVRFACACTDLSADDVWTVVKRRGVNARCMFVKGRGVHACCMCTSRKNLLGEDSHYRGRARHR